MKRRRTPFTRQRDAQYLGRPWPNDQAIRLLEDQLVVLAAESEARQHVVERQKRQLKKAQERVSELETLLAEHIERSAHLTAELHRCQEQLGRGDHWTAPR
jgi:chromosome segregation ATPase